MGAGLCDTYTVTLKNGYPLKLRLVDIARGTAISLLMCNSEPYEKIDAVVSGLVELVRPFAPEAVLGVPEQGIPLVHGVGRALGMRRSYLLRKTPKAFDVDPLKIEYTSVTKTDIQSLYLSQEDARELHGKRVAVIEDVVNTGGSLKAVVDLLDQARDRLGLDIEVVGIFVVLTEGHDWQEILGPRTGLIHALGHIPVFRPVAYEPIPGTEAG